jgi:hypothetical protein
MESQLGTNMMTWYVIFPILVIAAAAIVWFVVKMQVAPCKRVAIVAISLFAFIGFAVVVLGVYYQINKPFAGSFKFYAYSTLAPDQRDPFTEHNTEQSVLMMRAVGYGDGEVRTLYHQNPDYPTLVYLFVPGKFITADLLNDVLTIPEVDADSFPRVEHTSLWWALTKDPYKLNVPVK